MTEPVWLSLRGYAERRGVSLYAVQTAIKSGRVLESALQREPDGTLCGIDAVAADAQWRENTDAGLAARTGADPSKGALGDLIDRAAPPPENVPDLPPAGESDTAAYQSSRARREHYQAQLAQLDVMKQTGQLGTVEGFIRAVTDAAQLAQDRILQVPSRIAPLIAAESDPGKIEALLVRELKECLHGIAERAAQLATAPRPGE